VPAGIGPGDTTLTTFTNIGDAADATLEINSGSTLTHTTVPFLEIAQQGTSTASVTVTGTNGGPSTLSLEGTDSSIPPFGAFLMIGGGGNGSFNVNGGALASIDAQGADLGGCCGAGFWTARDPGSQGDVDLTGTDSEIRVNSKHAFVSVGQNGTGSMEITDNAKLTVLGDNTAMHVGRFGTAVMNVNTGGWIEELLFLNVGSGVGSNGTLNLDGATSGIELKGITTADTDFSIPGVGAFLTVGAQGIGEVNITGGAKMTLNPGTNASDGTPLLVGGAGFNLGGDEDLGFGGDGTLNVHGAGSELIVMQDGFFGAGRANGGSGIISVWDGGKITMAQGSFGGFLADSADAGTAELNVDGATSVVDVGSTLGVGVDGGLASTSEATVSLSNGGTVKADEVVVGANGTIKGNGNLVASTGGTQTRVILNSGDASGTIDPGLSTGQIFIDGDLVINNGTLRLEALSLVDLDHLVLTGDLILNGGVVDVILGFVPGLADVLDFFDVAGVVDIGPDFGGVNAIAASGSGVPVGTPITVRIGNQDFSAIAVAAAPEPSTLLLLGLGIAGIVLGRRVRT